MTPNHTKHDTLAAAQADAIAQNKARGQRVTGDTGIMRAKRNTTGRDGPGHWIVCLKSDCAALIRAGA